MSKTDWRRALKFFKTDPEWRRKLFIGGLLLIIFPPIGWTIALGYRKEAASRLLEGTTPILPKWRGRHLLYLIEGIKATGVILVYYIPLFIIFWLLAIDYNSLRQHYKEIFAFFFLVAVCVPISFPLIFFLYVYFFSWIKISSIEFAVILIIFLSITFVIPSAFLRVSSTKTFIQAFNLSKVVRFIVKNIRSYVEAWTVSIVVSIMGILTILFAPWGIFWSYLVIIYVFNYVLYKSDENEVISTFKFSYFNKSKGIVS